MIEANLWYILTILICIIVIGINTSYYIHKTDYDPISKIIFDIINFLGAVIIAGIICLQFLPQFINYIID